MLIHRILHKLSQVELTAGRIALIYLLFGMMALYVSDVLFVEIFAEPLRSQVQAAKGGVEILATAGLIFGLTRWSREQLHEANDQVADQRDELDLLYRVFRHNFRNDINVILCRAERIKDQLAESPVEEDCALILRTIEKMDQYTEKISHIRWVTEDNNDVRIFDLAEVVRDVLSEHPHVSNAIEVQMSVSGPTIVRANSMLPEAIKEVVTNAIVHNKSESPKVAIEIKSETDSSGMTTLRISDNGPRIPQIEVDALEAEDNSQLLHTSGMGLWMVDWVIKHSNGGLSISGSDMSGAEVRIQLPVASNGVL